MSTIPLKAGYLNQVENAILEGLESKIELINDEKEQIMGMADTALEGLNTSTKLMMALSAGVNVLVNSDFHECLSGRTLSSVVMGSLGGALLAVFGACVAKLVSNGDKLICVSSKRAEWTDELAAVLHDEQVRMSALSPSIPSKGPLVQRLEYLNGLSTRGFRLCGRHAGGQLLGHWVALGFMVLLAVLFIIAASVGFSLTHCH